MPTIEQQAQKILQESFKNLEIIKKNPKTKFHIVGGMTHGIATHKDKTPYSKKELAELNYLSQIPQVVLGPILKKYCQLCGANLDTIRNPDYPAISRNAEKFCSKAHMIEYSKRKQIMEKNNATGLTWKINNEKSAPRSNGMVAHYSGTRKNYKSKKLKFKKGKQS